MILTAVLIALAAPAAGQPAPVPVCTALGAIKVCETKIRAITSTMGTNAAGQPISLKVVARRDNESNTADAIAYIGSTMMMLERTSTQAQRAAAMSQLIDGAAGNYARGHARLGAYSLTLRFDGRDMTLDNERTTKASR
jgi:hypothetical protein